MTAPYDPDHGELLPLIHLLGAVQAEMITSDLRDLRIPAVMTREYHEETDPDTGETAVVATGLFQVLVPEAFVEIATEVLGVTHLRDEGQATREEILAEFAQPAAPTAATTDAPPASLLRRSEVAGRRLLLTIATVTTAVVATVALRACVG